MSNFSDVIASYSIDTPQSCYDALMQQTSPLSWSFLERKTTKRLLERVKTPNTTSDLLSCFKTLKTDLHGEKEARKSKK